MCLLKITTPSISIYNKILLTHRRAHLALVFPAGSVVRDDVVLVRALGGSKGVGHDKRRGAVGRRRRAATGAVGPNGATVQSSHRPWWIHPAILHPCNTHILGYKLLQV